jgi:hypothetical protein
MKLFKHFLLFNSLKPFSHVPNNIFKIFIIWKLLKFKKKIYREREARDPYIYFKINLY